MAENKKVFSTGVGRAIYPSPYEKKGMNPESQKYECSILLTKEKAQKVIARMQDKAADTWGADWKKRLGETRIEGGNRKAVCLGWRPGTDKGYEEGTYLFKARSNQIPCIVDRNKNDITEQRPDIFMGENIEMGVSTYAMNQPQKGIQLGVYLSLDLIRIIGGGEPLIPKANPNAVFDDDELDEYPDSESSDDFDGDDLDAGNFDDNDIPF